ncbi:cyclodeaminase/cyclohydrolase family protein [Burkholderia metallica]|uniref:cyclodeaminase/cyclohydrolase family protein n=1 Tax=Burkholderia metallica TaxID=488729 RepID=UPI00158CA670|nr:cyclodeaminase/cyclohydrolase family protein [Burkholderia metallica]
MDSDKQEVLPGLLSRSTLQLLDDFGAGNASPGSGSAAALMGLLACKLIVTVCRKSLEKQSCQKDWATLSHIRDQIEKDFEPELRRLFEKDAREFDKVVDLRRKRDATENGQERANLARESNTLLEEATDNAFDIAGICMKLIEHGISAFEGGWHAVRGDSGAAISVAVSGVMSGVFIANLNIKTLKGRRYANANIERCSEIYAELGKKQTRAFACVASLNAEAMAAVQLELIGTDDEASSESSSENLPLGGAQ